MPSIFHKRVSGTIDSGPAAPAIIDGSVVDGEIRGNVRRKDPADDGLTGTLVAKIDGDTVEYPVQVNGKVRGKLTLPRSLAGAALEEAVRTHATFAAVTDGKPVRKLIVVPGKIINVVVG